MTSVTEKTLSDFDAELKEVHLLGQWTYEDLLVAHSDGPVRPYGVPYVWEWDVVYPKLQEACVMLPRSNDARRNMSFRNPATDMRAATQTVSVGMQAVVPGEVCWAHRHSIDALRFAVKGSPDLYTVVDGEKMPLETGDLVLTPAYTWHDHHNEGDDIGIWLDVLDTSLIFALNQTFFEEYGEEMQPCRADRSEYRDARGGLLRPAWEKTPDNPVGFRYPWAEVEPILRSFARHEGSPYDGVLMRYANPFTGGPTLKTLDAYLQLLRPGLETRSHRQTSSAVYYVIEGEGTTVVGDRELHWKTGDTFCVPHWLPHRHINRSRSHEAIMFVVSDIPALTALGLYREDPECSFGTAPLPRIPAELVKGDIAPLLRR